MDKIDELLTRGVDSIYPAREVLEKVLRSGKKLTLYQGFDPTGAQLHIGHAVAIRKLRQFQDLGHHVIFLIGDGTGQAGDPSGKMKARGKFMSREELRANAVDYVKQAGKIVRFDGENPVEIKYNSDWLNKLTLVDILNIAQNFSVQQLIERDMYQERMKKGETINLREFMYPLLQGYDSVAMNVDLEMGGTDQTFNMLAGRQLVQTMLGKEKFVLTVPLLTDAKGTKIGKTEGNVIALTDEPNDFYAKIMSLGDDAIFPCFTLLTSKTINEIKEIKEKIEKGENPMVYKKLLAYELTKSLNNETNAKNAQIQFETVHQQGQTENATATEFITFKTTWDPVELLVESKTCLSRSDAKRLLEQKAVDVDGINIQNRDIIQIKNGSIIKAGKKKFIRIVIK
jgi:tyrosyl-tRNA synthetase